MGITSTTNGGSYSPIRADEAAPILARLAEATGVTDPIEDVYPLSSVQEAMLFQTLASEAPDLYAVQQQLDITGKLDIDRFSTAWSLVIQRHPALRTIFAWKHEGRPAQIVCRTVDTPIEMIDLSKLEAPEAVIAERVEEDRSQRFALDEPPLMRLIVFRIKPDRHRLLWSQHHLLEDGWSAANVLSEVFSVYEGLKADRPPNLPQARPFREYIEYLEQLDADAAETFWRRTLHGLETPTLMTSPSEGAESQYVRTSRTLDQATSELLRRTARSSRVTLPTALMAGLALVLGRYRTTNDVAFCVVAPGRPYTMRGVESMVGMFINTLLLRVRIDEKQRVEELFRDVQRRQSELMEHEHSALGDVQRWSDLPAGTVLSDTLFAYWSFDAEGGSAHSTLRYQTIEGYGRTGFPFSITIEASDPLRIGLDFDASELSVDVAEGFLDHYATALAEMAAHPDIAVGEVEVRSARERARLAEYNGTAAPVPFNSVFEAFTARVEADAECVAAVCGNQSITYSELDRRSANIAQLLSMYPSDARVGLFMKRGFDVVAAMLGVMRSGRTYIPIDSDYPKKRIAHIISDAGAPVVLTDEELVAELPDTDADVLFVSAESGQITNELTRWDANGAPKESQPAYIIYTSGSTGVPKGVEITHGNLINYIWWAALEYGSGRHVDFPLYSSIGFDLTVTSLFVPLVTGGRVVIYGDQDPGEPPILDVFAADDVDVVKLTPSHLAILPPSSFQTSRIRALVVGGEELTTAAAWRVVDESGGRIAVFNEYGPTEATVGCMIHRYDPRTDTAPTVPIGKPAANTRIHLLNADGRSVPAGVRGEICVAGAGVGLGYVGRPDLTADSFVSEPDTGQSMYRTGDIGVRDAEGIVSFVGREDTQVKVRGHRIELGEVEAALSAHPKLAGAAVALREPRPRDTRIAAYYVPAPGAAPTVTELRLFLSERLPAPMVPQNFVSVSELPLNVHGKLDRDRLPTHIAATEQSTTYIPPATEPEHLVVSLAAELLGIEHVGTNDNFFDLGGHSLLSLRLIAAIHAETDVRISPRVILLNTLGQAAALLGDRSSERSPQPEEVRAIDARGTSSDGARSVGTSAFFFGPSDSPLFGIHSSPIGTQLIDRAVLLCPPVGWEYMRTHWALRKLAKLLSTSGFHVMRFDYFGTGDSSGEGSSVSVERWLQDIEAARDELGAAAGTKNVTAVGVRLGGTLVAVASTRGLSIDRLILWDPVIDGSEYLSSLDSMQDQSLRERKRPYAAADLQGELLGFSYPERFRAELQSLDLNRLPTLSVPTTLVASKSRAADRHLVETHSGWQYELVPDAGGWDQVQSSQTALLPAVIPGHIAELVKGDDVDSAQIESQR